MEQNGVIIRISNMGSINVNNNNLREDSGDVVKNLYA